MKEGKGQLLFAKPWQVFLNMCSMKSHYTRQAYILEEEIRNLDRKKPCCLCARKILPICIYWCSETCYEPGSGIYLGFLPFFVIHFETILIYLVPDTVTCSHISLPQCLKKRHTLCIGTHSVLLMWSYLIHKRAEADSLCKTYFAFLIQLDLQISWSS